MQTSDWSDIDLWLGNFRHLPNRPENYQPPNAHARISGILLSNAMATAAVKKISIQIDLYSNLSFSRVIHGHAWQ
jgi:hypothetical protein